MNDLARPKVGVGIVRRPAQHGMFRRQPAGAMGAHQIVVKCADQIVKIIIATYLEPNKTFPELRNMATSGLIDPLREFSETVRAESQRLNFGPPE